MSDLVRWSEAKDGISYLQFWKAEPSCVLVIKHNDGEFSIQTSCTRFPSLTISGSATDAKLLALTQAIKEIDESRTILETALEEVKSELSNIDVDLGQRLKDLKSHK